MDLKEAELKIELMATQIFGTSPWTCLKTDYFIFGVYRQVWSLQRPSKRRLHLQQRNLSHYTLLITVEHCSRTIPCLCLQLKISITNCSIRMLPCRSTLPCYAYEDILLVSLEKRHSEQKSTLQLGSA